MWTSWGISEKFTSNLYFFFFFSSNFCLLTFSLVEDFFTSQKNHFLQLRLAFSPYVCVYVRESVCVCARESVCVCVCERERESERESKDFEDEEAWLRCVALSIGLSFYSSFLSSISISFLNKCLTISGSRF